jgi:hypothetical protein
MDILISESEIYANALSTMNADSDETLRAGEMLWSIQWEDEEEE